MSMIVCPHGFDVKWCSVCALHCSVTSSSSAICPDHLTLANLGEADCWRGRFVRFLIGWLDLAWPVR